MEKEPQPERKPLKYTDGKETYTFKPDKTVVMTFRDPNHVKYNCILQLTSEMEVKAVVYGNEWLIGFMLDLEMDGNGNSMKDYFGWLPRHVTADERPDWIADGWWDLQRAELEHPEDLIG